MQDTIDWEVGQVVWDVIYGKGEVARVDESFYYPVGVVFDDGDTADYTLYGEMHEQTKRSLFFSEPVITAELFPPKKPFKSMLKVGDLIAIKEEHRSDAVIVYFLKEDKRRIYYKHTGWHHASLHKDNVSVYPLGEEIKFR